MNSLHRWSSCATAACAALLFSIAPAGAQADELSGQLTDAATGVPVAGATVKVLGTNEVVQTDAQGRYAFDVAPGKYELSIEATLGDERFESRYVNQRVPQRRQGTPRVYTTHFLDEGHERLEHAVGLPSFSGSFPEEGGGSIPITDVLGAEANPLGLTIPSDTNPTIRVGRRQDHTGQQGCTDSSNPIVGIDEMTLDEYVKGVLPPEIGVFRNLPGASEVYKAFAIAAKSYALYFVVHYGPNNRRTLNRTVDGMTWFHIDDTACNQRYSDDRMTITTNAAQAVASKILVDKSNPNNIEKYEYAASCGKNGTRPEHQNAIVPDNPSVSSCVGSWCGHNSCAGHADHPNVSGSDRCLVRGICQWGAASWGEVGKTYTWMLAHYQPNLEIKELGPTGPESVVLTGYAYTDADDISGSGVADVSIALSDGQSTATNASGQYRFDAVRVDLGSVDITATKSGYETATRSKDLVSGATNWGSIQLVPGTSSGDDTGGSQDAGTVADTGGSSDDAGLDDAGVVTDAGSNSGGDIGGDASGERNSSLGPLVKPSRGVQGGCSSAPSDAPSGLAALLVALGLVGLSRRRV
ncbi:hypothetical protein FIV42_19895 [Persicimonas caeni]|uniref:Sporulation stage II protein D amidase enhancer LytB N-terminal domain-containing protein n=1 Tax=Persicimonas caeni TaxID=2292766 RepID=A0A4Y6PX72_PERCE|nr:carboxypeptidase regulatory-like domain-containing protein [Persicimonas caeni]QDG52921.1 hypothetical protein FIV42_19895 [Persicimonas caeni]QED34143.1 hypothetical protein FRD00_19890 [Persicimonas caeni]